MSLINNIKNYFGKKENNEETGNAPEGVCPNCWGKQEWEGQFYKKIKVNNITPKNNTYDSFINDVASKLEKITLKDDILICETCQTKYNE